MTPETKELKPAICVIGSGPGGLAVAAAAGARDVPTVLIEKGRMGGESLNRSSIPAQALIAAAERINAFRGGEPFGIKTQRVTVDFGAVHEHVRDVVDTLAPNAARERMTGLGVQVIEGTARFTDLHTRYPGDPRPVQHPIPH
jgi:pyruvate/2-oxoglutarate dehydrogenase complex dihydrolipoamide dehydrogenase (E3) component